MEEEAVSYKGGIFFEKQNEKDCLIHSVNNALGRQALTKGHVLKYIEKNVEKIHTKWCRTGNDPEEKVRKYLSTVMMDKNTLFSADVIWKAALDSGAVGKIVKIPGFSSRYSKDLEKAIPEWARSRPIVILGETPSGTNHAIALRDGLIFDSELPGPVRFSSDALKRSLTDVHAAFVFG